MLTNAAIDKRLILEAQELGHHRTKKEAVSAALEQYVQGMRQQQIIALFGTIDYHSGHDHRRARRMKRN